MGTARRRSPLPFHASAAQVGVCQFSAYVRVEVPFAGTLLEDGGDESDGDGGGDSADDELDGDGAGMAPRAPTVAPSFDLDAFSATVRGIQRINGATYISTALRCGFFALCILAYRQLLLTRFWYACSKAATMFAAPECNAARRCLVLLTDGRISSDEATAAEAEAAAQAAAPHCVQFYALGVGRGVDCDALTRIVAPGAPPERGTLAPAALLRTQHLTRRPTQLPSAIWRCAPWMSRSGDAWSR